MTEQNDSDRAHELAVLIHDVLAVENVMIGVGDGRAVKFQGRLLVDPESAYEQIAARFRTLGYTPLLRPATEPTNPPPKTK